MEVLKDIIPGFPTFHHFKIGKSSDIFSCRHFVKGIENKELGSGNVDDLDVSEMAGKNRRNVGCYDML